MEFDAGSKFNYKLGEILKKHGVTKCVAVFHPGETYFNTVEAVYFGDPSVEWCVNALEMCGKELEKRIQLHQLNSCGPGIPEEVKAN